MLHPQTQNELRKTTDDSLDRQASIREILVLHHSHFDLGYTHSQPIVEELHREFMDQALDLLEATAEWPAESAPKWTCEVTWPVLKWLQTADKSQVDRLRQFLCNGRMDIGGMLCSTTPLSTAEQLAEQLYPMRELRERLGTPIRTVLQHDVNGLPWPAADLMLDAGVDLFIMSTNAHLGGKVQPYPGLFHWVAPSGRKLLTVNSLHYSMFDQFLRTWEGDLASMRDGWAECAEFLQQHGYGYDFIYLTATHPPQAWDNSPPNMATARLIRAWNEAGNIPPMRYVTPTNLLDRLREISDDRIPSLDGDWTDYWNFGCGSTAVETQVARQAQANLFIGDLLRASEGRVNAAADRVRRQAYENVNWFTEHTWGADRSMQADCPHVRSQLALKKQYAYQSAEQAEYLLVDALERLAGNATESRGPVEAVLVVNPAPIAYHGPVAIPTDWHKDEKRLRTSRFRYEARHDSPAAAPLFGPVELPGYGWKIIPLAELGSYVPANPVSAGESPDAGQSPDEHDTLTVSRREGIGYIETPHHRLEYHSATGRILSLRDKKTGWEALDRTSQYTLFEYVRERPDPLIDDRREAYYERDLTKERLGRSCWKSDWRAAYERPSRMNGYHVDATPAAATLVLQFDAPGVDYLEQRYTLHAHTPRIDVEVTLDKPDIREPEATYFAVPLNLDEGWRAHFDTAGVAVELDAEQLPGSCRGWVTSERFAAMHDEKHGVTLLTPDAPMVQFGGFHFGRELQAVPRPARPELLAWATNNYWNTNFSASQPGRIRLRYALVTHGPFDARAAVQRAAQLALPVQVHPVVDRWRELPACDSSATGKLEARPTIGRLVDVDTEDVHVVYVKPADDGRGAICRLLNLHEEPSTIHFGLAGLPVGEAYVCNTLEEDLQPLTVVDDRARVPLQPKQITNVRMVR